MTPPLAAAAITCQSASGELIIIIIITNLTRVQVVLQLEGWGITLNGFLLWSLLPQQKKRKTTPEQIFMAFVLRAASTHPCIIPRGLSWGNLRCSFIRPPYVTRYILSTNSSSPPFTRRTRA